jgi:hypothetical protein
MLLVLVGPAGRPVKPEAATAVVELLMLGVRTPETCWAVHKRQVMNLVNCSIWLIDLLKLYVGYFVPTCHKTLKK